MRNPDFRFTGRIRRLAVAATLVAGVAVAQSGVALTFAPGIPSHGTGYKTPFRSGLTAPQSHLVLALGIPSKGTGYKTP